MFSPSKGATGKQQFKNLLTGKTNNIFEGAVGQKAYVGFTL